MKHSSGKKDYKIEISNSLIGRVLWVLPRPLQLVFSHFSKLEKSHPSGKENVLKDYYLDPFTELLGAFLAVLLSIAKLKPEQLFSAYEILVDSLKTAQIKTKVLGAGGFVETPARSSEGESDQAEITISEDKSSEAIDWTLTFRVPRATLEGLNLISKVMGAEGLLSYFQGQIRPIIGGVLQTFTAALQTPENFDSIVVHLQEALVAATDKIIGELPWEISASEKLRVESTGHGGSITWTPPKSLVGNIRSLGDRGRISHWLSGLKGMLQLHVNHLCSIIVSLPDENTAEKFLRVIRVNAEKTHLELSELDRSLEPSNSE